MSFVCQPEYTFGLLRREGEGGNTLSARVVKVGEALQEILLAFVLSTFPVAANHSIQSGIGPTTTWTCGTEDIQAAQGE